MRLGPLPTACVAQCPLSLFIYHCSARTPVSQLQPLYSYPLMPDVFVQTFTHLKDKPNADQALKLLQRTASLVKPIMRKHGWVLPVLSEFFPENPNLLGESPLCLLVASSAGC